MPGGLTITAPGPFLVWYKGHNASSQPSREGRSVFDLQMGPVNLQVDVWVQMKSDGSDERRVVKRHRRPEIPHPIPVHLYLHPNPPLTSFPLPQSASSVMTDSRYAALPHLDTSDPLEPPRPSFTGSRQSRTSTQDRPADHDRQDGPDALDGPSDSESDVSFRDTLDVEPFDEKQRVDERFRDEPSMEDGEEGYTMEPRRVSTTGWASLRSRREQRGLKSLG